VDGRHNNFGPAPGICVAGGGRAGAAAEARVCSSVSAIRISSDAVLRQSTECASGGRSQRFGNARSAPPFTINTPIKVLPVDPSLNSLRLPRHNVGTIRSAGFKTPRSDAARFNFDIQYQVTASVLARSI